MCIAYRVPGETLTNVEYGLSLCNPLDQFEKKKARLIAGGRLNRHPHQAVPGEGEDTRLVEWIMADILDSHDHHTVEYHMASTWFEKRAAADLLLG